MPAAKLLTVSFDDWLNRFSIRDSNDGVGGVYKASVPSQCGMTYLKDMYTYYRMSMSFVHTVDNLCRENKDISTNCILVTDRVGGAIDRYLKKSKLNWVRSEEVYNPNSKNMVFSAYYHRTPEDAGYRGPKK